MSPVVWTAPRSDGSLVPVFFIEAKLCEVEPPTWKAPSASVGVVEAPLVTAEPVIVWNGPVPAALILAPVTLAVGLKLLPEPHRR